MKTTYNLDIDLMLPMQTDKEIVFNEALAKLDIFGNNNILEFIHQVPEHPRVGEKYILLSDSSIIYCTDLSKGFQKLIPKLGMIMFVIREQGFFTYTGDKWIKVIFGANNNQMIQNNKFIGIKDEFIIPENTYYTGVYLNQNTVIKVAPSLANEITLIIKQNSNTPYKINWDYKVLWINKNTHIMTQIPNAMDIIKLYAMPEIDYFCGHIIAQNFQF